MKKTLAATALGAVLTLTSLGSAFAAEVPAQSGEHGQQAVTAIKVKAASNLDETAKEKAKAIFDQMRKGTLTREQAKAQLQELGVDMDVDFGKAARGAMVRLDTAKFDNLDEAAKEKAKAILEQIKTGTLTKEQTKAQLQELGIDMEMDFGKGRHFQVKMDKSKFDSLDDATKEKVKSVLDQMKAGTLAEEQVKAKLQELGIDMEVKFGKNPHFQVKMDKSKMDTIDEATKEKVKSIFDQMKAGSLTEEQVKAKLQELGINIVVKSVMTKDTNKVMKAVKIDDAAQQ